MKLNFKNITLIILLPLLQLLIIYSSFRFIIGKNLPAWIIFLQISLTCITEICLFFLLRKQDQKKRLEKELRDAEYLKEINTIQENSIRQQELRLNELQQNMLLSISNLLENLSLAENKTQIVNNIDNIIHHNIMPHCQNQIVNAILTEKILINKENDITLNHTVNIDNHCPVVPRHLCSVFSNLLDNAIEAVLSLPPDQRIIDMKTQRRGDYLVIVVKNPFGISYQGHRTKADRGYGTQILKDIASHYQGDYLTTIEHNHFTASIILQIG